MTKERILNAVKVIEYAIKHGISVRAASIKSGHADTYVKNVKRAVNQSYDAGTIDDDDYNLFMSAYENYTNVQQLDKETSVSDVDEPITEEKIEFIEMGDTATVNWKNGSPQDQENQQSLENDFELLEYDDTSDGEHKNHYGYPPNHIKTLDDLLERAEVDLEVWRVERHIVNKWDVTAFKSGYPTTWENFQVKATLIRRKEVVAAQNFAEIFKNLAKNYAPPAIDNDILSKRTFDVTDNVENNLLEVSLFDLHIGKLGWAGEVGENYDTKIARERFLDAITTLLKRAKGFTYNKIMFPIGNDFFNSDNQFNTTTKGTPQDEDLRWQKTWDVAIKLLVDAIMLLKATGVPIEIPVISGNHDQERMKYMGSVIDAWFRNDDQVNVNNNAKMRKYYQWGEVMLGYTHGNEEKENSLPMLMAIEDKEMWGRTNFHEWHLGHFHKKRNLKFTVLDKAQILNEELGVTVRYLSSLTGTEEWHYKKGYIGSQKAGEAFIWNDKSGMVGHLNFNFTDFDREH